MLLGATVKPSGLSIRLATLMLVATLVMQLGHGLYRFSVDVPKAKQQSIEDIDQLVKSLQPALAEALYQFNENLSDKLLKTFQANDAVRIAWLLDYDESGIGVWVRDEASESSVQQYEATWPLHYEDKEIGKLVLQIDMLVVEQAAIDHVWNIILFSVFIGLFALLLLYFIAQAIVTRPIESLSNVVGVFKSHDFTKHDVATLDNVKAYYEVETLRLTIKAILLELADHLGRNEQDMMNLKEFNHALEEQVLIRTEELELAKNNAEVANRAKTDFLNVITHELRTPLNGVLGFSGILKTRELTEKDKKLVENIEHSGQGLLLLLNDIIDYVGLESKSLTCQMFSVHDALLSAFNERKAAAQSKELEYNFEVDSTITMLGDPKRLAILVRQLLDNAIKFTHTGSVLLTCFPQTDGTVLLSVTDTGIGMEDSCYGVFNAQAFTQGEQGLNRSNEGLGLGLAIVERICKKWPAHMTFEKNTPQGTKVNVVLCDIKEKR